MWNITSRVNRRWTLELASRHVEGHPPRPIPPSTQSPFTIFYFWINFSPTIGAPSVFTEHEVCPIRFGSVAAPVGGLEVVQVFDDPLRCFVTPLPKFGYRPYLVNDKGKRMPAVTWLVIMNRSKTSSAYSTGGIHCTEPGPAFAAEVSVGVPWVS